MVTYLAVGADLLVRTGCLFEGFDYFEG